VRIVANTRAFGDGIGKIMDIFGPLGAMATICSVVLFRFDLISWGLSIRILAVGALLCIAALILALLYFLTAIVFRLRSPGDRLVLAFICVVPMAIFQQVVGIEGLKAPYLVDISTDITDPPIYLQAANLRGPGHNSTEYNLANGTLQAYSYPDIVSLNTDQSMRSTFRALRNAAVSKGWTITYDDWSTGKLEAVVLTPIMGCEDDIVLRVTAAGENNLTVDMRSSSRQGFGDMGRNARRIEGFLTILQDQLGKQQGH